MGNPHIAIRYVEEIPNRIANLARERGPDIDFEEILCNEDVELKRAIANIASNSASSPRPSNSTESDNERPKGKKGEWQGETAAATEQVTKFAKNPPVFSCPHRL